MEAVFWPEAGGRMLRLRHIDHGDLLVPLEERSIDLENWPKAGAFPLFPFHNRLQGAAFPHEGRLIRLRPNSGNGMDVMHGPAHRRPWVTSDMGGDFLEMRLEYRADDSWPFDFTAIQRFELHGNNLSVALRLTNTGGAAMPCGMGWHPYFRSCSRKRIRTNACRQWKLAGGSDLPEQLARHAGTGEVAIESGQTLHFSDWTEAAALVGDGASMRITADTGMSHLVIHLKGDYLCIEPASHVAGAFADLPNASSDFGLRILAPGDSLSGTFRVDVESPPPGSDLSG
ncbi:hypothetical protein P1J78_08220 [Psychromarinibacter sp. C21-152]|uniref:Aldose 1-epimerase n=1 Tax=Psychromarinibacter sediminicola TaxID=3033385 RepID=A0AAE3T7Z7_9RHOB|nr:hypothetical protein [Psychromarinibacter sediminicola]MDF0600712.1 hypothetical protein [Psychromarinibacter sediminicola]